MGVVGRAIPFGKEEPRLSLAGSYKNIHESEGDHNMLRVVCKGKVKPDVNIEEYLCVARKMVEETRKEKGCIMYTLHEDINDPTIFTTIEEWVDKEAIDQHNQSEHVFKYVKELRKMRESTELHVYQEVQ